MTWWSGTRACARCSRRRWGCRGRRSWRRGGRRRAGGRGGERGCACGGAVGGGGARALSFRHELPLRAHLFELSAERARAAAGAASHRGRRLVAGSAAAGLVGVLRGAAARGCGGAAGAAGAIRRLHAVAARGAGGRGRRRQRAVAAAVVLDGSAGRAAGADRACRSTGRGLRCRATAAGSVALAIDARAAWRAGGAWPRRTARACSWCCRPGCARC